jgi:hypothetical protein
VLLASVDSWLVFLAKSTKSLFLVADDVSLEGEQPIGDARFGNLHGSQV